MNGRQFSRTVTFHRSFQLPGMSEPHAHGTFEVLVQEEQLDVMWDARRSTMSILLSYPGYVESMPVTSDDLEEAIRKDEAAKAEPPRS